MDLSQKVDKAIKMIQKQAIISPLILGVSGGKDSLVLCQLFKLAGIKPKYFHMYFMPNLRIEHDLMSYVKARFDIKDDEIFEYPSEHFVKAFIGGYYTWACYELKNEFKPFSRKQLFRMIAKQHKACICTGVKKSDGIQMQRLLDGNKGIGIYPLIDWDIKDVFTFLKAYKIDIPPLILKGCRGVGLTDESVLFMQKFYPDDIERISVLFPFVKAIIYKYEYYDLKKTVRIV